MGNFVGTPPNCSAVFRISIVSLKFMNIQIMQLAYRTIWVRWHCLGIDLVPSLVDCDG